jgi:hypothetical protein
MRMECMNEFARNSKIIVLYSVASADDALCAFGFLAPPLSGKVKVHIDIE